MEPLAVVIDEFKRLSTTANDLAHGLLNSGGRTSIAILKRLQREAFSDIMKLRDRQDKVERLLTFYKSSKGSPFQEASTHARGNVDVVGACFFTDDNEHNNDVIRRSGIRTGIDARLRFETEVREKDKLVAEFIADGKGDMLGGPLSLSKVLYAAHFSDWFSAVAIPIGAQCRDVGFATTTYQEKGLTSYSDSGPPLLHQNNGGGVGITVRKTNLAASFAQFLESSRIPVNAGESACNYLTTFGQIVWQLSRNTKLSLLGVRRKSRPPTQNNSLGPLAFPLAIFKHNSFSEMSVEEDRLRSREIHNSDGSISVMINSEIDDSTKIGGWIESKTSKPSHLRWAVTVSDMPEDEFGWGFTLGGLLHGPNSFEHFQVESYLNMNFGKRFTLQPGFAFVKDGATQFPALMIRSSWSL